MSDSQGRGKHTDDRTILDPLSSDELKALREARQRMQAKKERENPAHQIVIGPDSGEDLGEAPTRAMPALPTFDGQVTLDQIGVGRGKPERPTDENDDSAAPAAASATAATADAPVADEQESSDSRDTSELPDVRDSAPTIATSAPVPPAKTARAEDAESPRAEDPRAPSEPPASATRPIVPLGNDAVAQGFGENTLLWMQPPRVPSTVGPGGIATPDVLPKSNPKEVLQNRIKAIFAGVGFAVALLAVGWVAWSPKERGVLELHTNPPKAAVTINGKAYSEVTPVKLTLPAGEHQIALALQGHEPFSFTTNIEPSITAVRKDVDLSPISRPGLMTVSVEVQPVAANITMDGDIYAGRRSLKLANLDPRRAHTISVEAGGYVKIEQNVEPGRLKPKYRFVLEKDTTLPQ